MQHQWSPSRVKCRLHLVGITAAALSTALIDCQPGLLIIILKDLRASSTRVLIRSFSIFSKLPFTSVFVAAIY